MTAQNTNSPDPKIAAREEARKRRAKLDHGWIESASAQIAARALELPALQQARTIGCYIAVPHEVQTKSIFDGLFAAGKRVAVPAWNRATAQYGMSEFRADEPMHPGHLSVPEPLHPRWLLAADIDVMIVPVVAFDRFLRRLGHGGGNFDRLLANHHGVKIGIAFEGQRLTVVPVDPHDVLLNLVVTEQRVYDGTNAWAGMIDAPADLVAGGGEPP